MKNSSNTKRTETATFRIVAECLNQTRQRALPSPRVCVLI